MVAEKLRVQDEEVLSDEQQKQPQPQPQPQQQKQQQPTRNRNRNRNRQKERLARRAAEQEAASAAAEAEAASMTDRRAFESAYMRRRMDEEGLVEREIAPDGHCLFSAVADQLLAEQLAMPLVRRGLSLLSSSSSSQQQQQQQQQQQVQEAPYKTVRKVAAAYMLEHKDDFAPFVLDGDGDGDGGRGHGEDMVAYAARIRDTAAWGGEPELTALARAYGVTIRVLQQDGRTEVFEAGGRPEGDEDGAAKGDEDGAAKRVVWLAYYRHGYGLGEHYNSLRRR